MAQMAPIRAYYAPDTLTECLEILRDQGDRVAVLAGGQSLIPLLRSRQARADSLLDLVNVGDLRRCSDGDATLPLRLGATVRYREIVEDSRMRAGLSALRDAAATIGDRQVQNRGTLGGNIVFKSFVSDMKPVAMCLTATLDIVGLAGARTVSAHERLQGRDAVLDEGELLQSVTFPPFAQGSGSAYVKYGITANGRPVIGVAAMVTIDEHEVCADARFVVGGVDRGPDQFDGVAQVLVGRRLNEDDLDRAADEAADRVRTHDDLRASALYRTQLIRIYGRRALRLALSRAREDRATWNNGSH